MTITAPGIYIDDEGDKIRVEANTNPATSELYPWAGKRVGDDSDWPATRFTANGRTCRGDLVRWDAELPLVVEPIVKSEPVEPQSQVPVFTDTPPLAQTSRSWPDSAVFVITIFLIGIAFLLTLLNDSRSKGETQASQIQELQRENGVLRGTVMRNGGFACRWEGGNLVECVPVLRIR